METLKDPNSHIHLLLLYVLLKLVRVWNWCVSLSQQASEVRGRAPLLLLSFCFLFAPLIPHCLLPHTSLSALPKHSLSITNPLTLFSPFTLSLYYGDNRTKFKYIFYKFNYLHINMSTLQATAVSLYQAVCTQSTVNLQWRNQSSTLTSQILIWGQVTVILRFYVIHHQRTHNW